ncbi:MAG: right-handed parallel beta-helix repeat-containing protein, partial [Bacteroidetes bacterium]|nr:right-handed parallel beta-helix repeat-containing protein [Bacteroidota bacterium]
MACVLTVAVVEEGCVTVGHVGDTRLYEVRRDGIRKVTRDHSPVGLREDEGALGEIEAMNHPRRNEILRDLGSACHDPDDAHFIDIYTFEFAPDSAFLLCSDGLTDLVPKRPIQQVLLDHAGHPEKGVQTLIELANEVGGVDNITAIVVEGLAFKAEPVPVAPAETFSPPDPPEGAAVAPARKPRLLGSRPAFFTYGWLAGCLLAVLPLLMVVQMLDHRLPRTPSAQVRAPQTLRVAPGEPGSYQTIGEALDAAEPGDVVDVAPGVYREVVRLKGGVAVVSPVPGAAVLRLDESGDSSVVVAERVQRARLVGFKIEGAAVGLHLRDAQVEVVDVEVTGASFAGVLVEGRTEAVLRASLVVDNGGSGVHIRGAAARPRLVQNVIRHNGTARASPGVLIEDGATPVLLRNVITGHAVEGIRLTGAAASALFQQDNFFEVDGEGNAGGKIGGGGKGQ